MKSRCAIGEHCTQETSCSLHEREALSRQENARIRIFDTGATRDTDQGKLDYEGFLNPFVLERFAQYMHDKRTMKDGSVRDADNWQKGMPIKVYLKSLLRHVFELWRAERQVSPVNGKDYEDTLCAIIFNAQGLLLETIKVREVNK